MKREKVLVGMSGGVDSSVAAAYLLENGMDVTGCTLHLFDQNPLIPDFSASEDAKAVCEKLGINHTLLDLRERFSQTVINDFIKEYYLGRTPNPCIVCNKNIKFDEMLNFALDNGFDKIATGHYALIEQNSEGRFLLKRAADHSKDQTYVLYSLTQHQLAHTVFPLAQITKDTARCVAERYGFSNAHKPDSQDICFVPDGDYASFIENFTGKPYQKGNYIDENGCVLGQHNGVIRYTIGQRKGLGIALGKPAFVTQKDADNNTVTLSTDENALFYSKVLVENVNFIPFDTLEKTMNVKAKLRYRHTEQPAIISPLDNGQILIEFNSPQRAPSPGQAAVFYDGDIVVGGGTILKGVK
ncbi:MAG: tRNA 2-thiouridine(34) synthase MnmA [Ruminococcaceae bacterium]|nr:tRNA 2-thiouridine(34) synthase MnmA [Oscillospiraceae bacterium]